MDAQENEIIISNFKNKSLQEMILLLSNRKEQSIRCQAWKLGITRTKIKPKWAPKEINIIKNCYFIKTKEELLEIIPDRSWKAIRLKA